MIVVLLWWYGGCFIGLAAKFGATRDGRAATNPLYDGGGAMHAAKSRSPVAMNNAMYAELPVDGADFSGDGHSTIANQTYTGVAAQAPSYSVIDSPHGHGAVRDANAYNILQRGAASGTPHDAGHSTIGNQLYDSAV